MDDPGQQLESIDDARPGSREVGRGVDHPDATVSPRRRVDEHADSRQPFGFCRRGRQVVATGHEHHDLGLGGAHVGPAEGPRVLARLAQHRPTAGADDEVGSLAAGKWADVVLIDENVNVKSTYLGGRKVGRAS